MRASGCRVIGDPDRLVTPPQVSEQSPPAEHIPLAVAAAAVAGAVDAAGRSDARVPGRRGPTPTAVPRTAQKRKAGPTAGSAGQVDRVPVGRLIRELGRRVRHRVRRGR